MCDHDRCVAGPTLVLRALAHCMCVRVWVYSYGIQSCNPHVHPVWFQVASSIDTQAIAITPEDMTDVREQIQRCGASTFRDKIRSACSKNIFSDYPSSNRLIMYVSVVCCSTRTTMKLAPFEEFCRILVDFCGLLWNFVEFCLGEMYYVLLCSVHAVFRPCGGIASCASVVALPLTQSR